MTTLPDRVVIATRGSPLALWQSRWVADRLTALHTGLRVDLEIVKTTGDRFQQASLQVIGGKGAFTKEITEAVLDSRADLAVHSLKDLPTDPVPGLKVWAYPARFDPRDAWIGRDGTAFRDLPADAVVATGSLRRRALALHRHPGITVAELRGNVETRLRKFDEGEMSGIFLAMAGLKRLGLSDRVSEALAPGEFVPAPGQGALAVEGRDDDVARAFLSPLDDAGCRDRITAERAFLAVLEAGCQVPVGAFAELEDEQIVLRGVVLETDGSRIVDGTERGPRSEAATVGRRLAGDLLARGAKEILDSIREASESDG